LRKTFNEICKLADDDGHYQSYQQRNRGTHDNDDDKRRHQPVHSQPLDAVGDGIEQIGKHHPGDEWQQNFAQQGNDCDDCREHRNPE
jgi:hypothetical protein